MLSAQSLDRFIVSRMQDFFTVTSVTTEMTLHGQKQHKKAIFWSEEGICSGPYLPLKKLNFNTLQYPKNSNILLFPKNI